MTRSGDYFPEMPGMAITEAEVEVLLGGRASPHPRLDDLAAALNRIDLDRLEVSLDDKIGRFSLRAAALAQRDPVPAKAGILARLTPRLATFALTAIVLVGTSGLAMAADASAPGDILYGLDRAVERIGLNDGGIDERIEEAALIAERGQTAAALDHIADSLPAGSSEAADALHRAADQLGIADSNSEVQESVGDMLDWIATTDAEGRDFGQGVAERARELGNKGAASEDANGNGPGTNNGNGPPGGSPPGQSGK